MSSIAVDNLKAQKNTDPDIMLNYVSEQPRDPFNSLAG